MGKRRSAPEINSGSMADIAFLLLVFFLMVTTIETEEGIFRILPPPLEDVPDPPKAKERDVFRVLVNMDNDLLVENQYTDIKELKGMAKGFIISNGVFEDLPLDPDLPNKQFIKRDSIISTLSLHQQELKKLIDTDQEEMSTEEQDDHKKAIRKKENVVYKWGIKQKVYDRWGKYKPVLSRSIISMENNNGTDYKTYIGVQSELTSAIYELRDDLAMEKFSSSFVALEKEFNRKKNLSESSDDLKEKIEMVKEVYPLKIVEAEPSNVSSY